MDGFLFFLFEFLGELAKRALKQFNEFGFQLSELLILALEKVIQFSEH